MNYPFTDNFDQEFLLENMMGPNSMRITEELTNYFTLEKDMRVLDLGCGKALSSVLLAKKYYVTVYATDLWVEPTENYRNIQKLGLKNKIIPIYADAEKLPYAKEYFDAVVSVDSYHYFGAKEGFLEEKIIPFVKKGGTIAVTIPGVKKDFNGVIPEKLQPFLSEEITFHSCYWWEKLWSKVDSISLEICRQMDCHDLAWQDWLQTDNSYAKEDIKMMEAENGEYFNLVQLVAKVK